MENIPLNGRSFQTLIMLTPGAVVTQPDVASQYFLSSQQTLASSLGSGGAFGELIPPYQVGGPSSIRLL